MNRNVNRDDDPRGGSFGEYMARKIAKQREQFLGQRNEFFHGSRDDAKSSSAGAASTEQSFLNAGGVPVTSNLFKDVCIYVTGLTNPPHASLKILMQQHGGMFENYLLSQVTHVVADTLSAAKYKQLSTSKHILVRPQWVLDSIAASRILPTFPYRVQPPRGMSAPAAETGMATIAESLQKKRSSTAITSGASSSSSSSSSSSLKDGGGLSSSAMEPPFLESVPVPRLESPTLAKIEPSGGIVLAQANDVEGFLKNSRLHFIGSWRQRFLDWVHEQGIQLPSSIPLSENRIIIHVDMDMFFASCALLSNPLLKGRPFVVAHSKGAAEVSSASYEARSFGVRAGMWMTQARELCPNLEVVPYDFALYEKIAYKVYRILFNCTPYVQSMSVDESYLEVHNVSDPLAFVRSLRRQIAEETGCTASAGISHNMLLARIATKKAKPNGEHFIDTHEEEQLKLILAPLPVDELPGVGPALRERLVHELGIRTCQDLQTVADVQILRDKFGSKTGDMLYEFSRGIDNRPLQCDKSVQRKSIGTDVNYAIRVADHSEVFKLLQDVSLQVERKMQIEKAVASRVTLRVLSRHRDAPRDPPKFMGHGWCDVHNRAGTLWRPTNDATIFAALAFELWKPLNIPPSELRGIGIHLFRLEPEAEAVQRLERAQRPRKYLDKMWERTFQKTDHRGAVDSSDRTAGAPAAKVRRAEPRVLSWNEYIPFLIDNPGDRARNDASMSDFHLSRMRWTLSQLAAKFGVPPSADEDSPVHGMDVVRELVRQWIFHGDAPPDVRQAIRRHMKTIGHPID
eukprot:ANDGO_06954.mRNA.1 DNA repair protein REV1